MRRMQQDKNKRVRKMAVSATNHGFTIPAAFCQRAHVKKEDIWEWVIAKSSGLLLVTPIDRSQPVEGEHLVKVQEMRLRRKQSDRVQFKLNLSVKLIRQCKLNVRKCRIEWVLAGEYLHGIIALSGENVLSE